MAILSGSGDSCQHFNGPPRAGQGQNACVGPGRSSPRRPMDGLALCRICVLEKWDACHTPNVRNDKNRHRCPRSDRGRLLVALTALVPTTHVSAMGCVHHPG